MVSQKQENCPLSVYLSDQPAPPLRCASIKGGDDDDESVLTYASTVRRLLRRESNSSTVKSRASWKNKMSKLKDMSFSRRRSSAASSTVSNVSSGCFKTVSFDENLNKTYSYDQEQNDDMWWNSAELSASKVESRLEISTDDDVQDYLNAYNVAFKQVYSTQRLNSECLRDLVKGLAKGFRGLENLSASGSLSRIKSARVKEHVLSVVHFYHDLLQSNAPLQESFRSYESTGECTSSGSGTEKALRYHSTKSSASSRHFATALGKAERLAAKSSFRNSYSNSV